MAKRVYELAKEMGVDNASLMKFLTDNNIEVKSHMSTLDDSAIAKGYAKLSEKIREIRNA